MSLVKSLGKKGPFMTPSEAIEKLYKKKKENWHDFISEGIQSVCDVDDDENIFVELVHFLQMELEDFAILLIDLTIANHWLTLEKLIIVAAEIHAIEYGSYLDYLNENVQAHFNRAKLVEEFMAMDDMEDNLSIYNEYFGDGDFSLDVD